MNGSKGAGGEKNTGSYHAQAKVSRITFRGLRHSAATLWLKNGVPMHIVAYRLGHKKPTMTWNICTHRLKGDQQAIAASVSRALYH